MKGLTKVILGSIILGGGILLNEQYIDYRSQSASPKNIEQVISLSDEKKYYQDLSFIQQKAIDIGLCETPSNLVGRIIAKPENYDYVMRSLIKYHPAEVVNYFSHEQKKVLGKYFLKEKVKSTYNSVTDSIKVLFNSGKEKLQEW